MFSKLGQFATVKLVRHARKELRAERENNFRKDIAKKILDQLIDCGQSKRECEIKSILFCKDNIYFNRDINQISLEYNRLVQNFKYFLTVSDIDGVLVHPLYFFHRLDKVGYPELIHSISHRNHEVILFSNRFEIPSWVYSLVVNLKINHLLAGSYTNQIPLTLPKNVARNNISTTAVHTDKNSRVLIDMLNPGASIDFRNKTIEIQEESGKTPIFRYLNKSNSSTRKQCMNKIFYSLLMSRKVVYLGSSKFDRDFYIDLLDFLTQKFNELKFEDGKKLDFFDFIKNLHYLDSNLSVV